MGLLSTSTSGAAGSRAAEVFGPRQLVARVIEHVVGRQLRRDIRAHASEPCRQKNGGEQQKRFHDPGGQHASVWKNPVRSFTGQARRRSGEGGSDGSNELLPGRGPLHQKLRSAVKADYLQFDGVVELKRVSHRAALPPLSSVISILSPTAVPVAASACRGSSNTDAAAMRIRAKRQGLRFSSMWTTVPSRSRYTTSMGKRMAKV